jgi:hypothetical protein
MFYITLNSDSDMFYNLYSILPDELFSDLLYPILSTHANTEVSIFELKFIIKSAIKQVSIGLSPPIKKLLKLYDLNIARCMVSEEDIESVENYYEVNKI